MGKRPTLSARCAATLFIAAFLMTIDAAEIRRRDGIHRVSKAPAKVTPGPRLDRRVVITACPASFSLCPDELGGGCCTSGYTCGTQSCFAMTEGPVTCNGRTGYYACGADVGGGCCPVGSVCERGGQCVPVAGGVSYSHDCSANSYLCPAELGYGCCRNGYACGSDQCYATEPLTNTFTQTVTTTDGDDTKTLTRTVTTTMTLAADSEPTGGTLPSRTTFEKQYPSVVSKVSPLVTEAGGGGGGLSGAQIGGAVGGAIALLAIILTVAFFIIRRLNHVAKVVKESGPNSTTPGSQADTNDYFKGTADTAEVESLSTDMSPRARHRSTSESPSLFGFRSGSTPSGGSGLSSRRHSHRSSTDSTGRNTPGTWTKSDGTAISSTRASGSRTSGSIDAGMGSETEPDEIAELETGERVVELPADPVATKTEVAGARNASPGRGFQKSVVVAGGGGGPAAAAAGRGEGLAPPAQGHKRSNSAAGRGAPQLDVVSEAGEFHGYYGPADSRLMGQTAAGWTPDTTETTTTTTAT
ncbi:hypothetical protein jhhlp_008085 [Lomentospora prolificans]|uniref:Uncharacterized protein n=1 Tax=Lomentospora prolificans TaxID=41688 RepID=A0A2N3MZG0_9PEZI|nr:hypothetical protein jhhlp_008085 [Lomentospora prolificans]